MGILSSLFGRRRDDDDDEYEDDGEYEEEDEEEDEEDEEPKGKLKVPKFPELYEGMVLNLTFKDGKLLLSGKLSTFTRTTMTIERTPGQLAFNTCDVDTPIYMRGYTKHGTLPFDLKGNIAESSRILCRIKNVDVVPYNEHRTNFRLAISAPVSLYYEDDKQLRNPENCQLVNISIGGALIESEYCHGEGEVLHMRIKINEYTPMTFLGQIIRVEEPSPGKFRYGFLFAQLTEQETTALTRTLFNLQTGNNMLHMRTSDTGHW